MDGLKLNYSMLHLSLNESDPKDDNRPIKITHESKDYIAIGVCEKGTGLCLYDLYLDEAQVRVLHAWLSTII
jgi:hypothetical protein